MLNSLFFDMLGKIAGKPVCELAGIGTPDPKSPSISPVPRRDTTPEEEVAWIPSAY